MRASLVLVVLSVASAALAAPVIFPFCHGQPDGLPCATTCTTGLYGFCEAGRCRGDDRSQGDACVPELFAEPSGDVGMCDADGYCLALAPGDCDGDGRVTIAELVGGVSALLEGATPCVAFNRRDFGVHQIVAAIAAALGD
jgi:hypothetical protein